MTPGDLLALQRPDGGFPSSFVSRGGTQPDCNGFTAAMVLRLIRHVTPDPAIAEVRRRALDYVETCASAVVPGAFAFWPDASRPAWAASVPADVDDTAIMLVELLRHGRIDRATALARLCRAVLPHRVIDRECEALPPWIAPGSFLTWIAPPDAGRRRPSVNVVDCCVNANVAALMSFLDVTHLPGNEAAVATVTAGIGWASDSRARLSALTPFYPGAHSLVEAVDHAVECGVSGLREPALLLGRAAGGASDADQGCCRSAYGSTVWHCPAIDAARALARACSHDPLNSVPAPHAAA